MNNFKIEQVYNFWNPESRGERYVLGDSSVEKFLNEVIKKIFCRTKKNNI